MLKQGRVERVRRGVYVHPFTTEEDELKLITLWITRTYDGDGSPEMVEAWDEYSADGNTEGMVASFDKAKASIGSDLAQWRVIEIQVDGAAIEAAFAPNVVNGIAVRDREGS